MVAEAGENPAPVSPSPAPEGEENRRGFAWFVRRFGTLVVLALLIAYFSFRNPLFLSATNISLLINNMTEQALVALGLTFVVAVGSFDLSVGAIAAASGIFAAWLMNHMPYPEAFVATLVIAALIGGLNGVLVSYGRLSGIVATLAMSFVVVGIELSVSNGYEISVPPENAGIGFLGNGSLGPIPMPTVVLAIVFAICYVILTRHRAGRYIAAIGDNALASYFAGIPIYRYVILSFVLAAVTSALAGLIVVARATSAQPTPGSDYLIGSFAAIYLGSTILSDGKPHMLGTLLGALFLAVLGSGITFVGFSYQQNELFEGIVLALAVLVSTSFRRDEIHTRFI
jgi:ribose transport system permease protein